VYSLVLIYHRALLVFLRASTLHDDGLPFKPCRLISHVTSTTILFELSKEALFPIATVVAPQVPPCILPGTLMTLVNHQGRSNTQDSVFHFYAMSVWPLGDFVYLPYSMIQENVTSARTKSLPPFNCPTVLVTSSMYHSSFLVLPHLS
jgi:hypothetical protein